METQPFCSKPHLAQPCAQAQHPCCWHGHGMGVGVRGQHFQSINAIAHDNFLALLSLVKPPSVKSFSAVEGVQMQRRKMGWGLALVTDRCPGSHPGKWLLSWSWKSTPLKKQIISSMSSLQEKGLKLLREPDLSSSEFCSGFQFQFQNDKAGKKIMETLAPIFTEISSQATVSKVECGWQAHDESGAEPQLTRVEMGLEDSAWGLTKTGDCAECSSKNVCPHPWWLEITNGLSTQQPYCILWINPQSTVAMLTNAKTIATCFLRAFLHWHSRKRMSPD